MYCQWIIPIICKDIDEKSILCTGCMQCVVHGVYTIQKMLSPDIFLSTLSAHISSFAWHYIRTKLSVWNRKHFLFRCHHKGMSSDAKNWLKNFSPAKSDISISLCRLSAFQMNAYLFFYRPQCSMYAKYIWQKCAFVHQEHQRAGIRNSLQKSIWKGQSRIKPSYWSNKNRKKPVCDVKSLFRVSVSWVVSCILAIGLKKPLPNCSAGTSKDWCTSTST